MNSIEAQHGLRRAGGPFVLNFEAFLGLFNGREQEEGVYIPIFYRLRVEILPQREVMDQDSNLGVSDYRVIILATMF